MGRIPSPWLCRSAPRKPFRPVRPSLEPMEPRVVLSATVQIDNGVSYQVIAGWGTDYTKEYEPGPAQVAAITGLVYGQLHLNLGEAGSLLEAPVPDFARTANDNSDPSSINWNGFQGWQEQDVHDNWINALTNVRGPNGQLLTAKQLGFTDYFLGGSIPNIRWENPWLDAIRRADPAVYRGEVAEEVLASVQYYRDHYGEVPPLFQFGYEEVTGNGALFTADGQDTYPGGPTQEMVDLVKTAGQRLAAAGFGSVKFIIGSEETVSSSLQLATAILSDPQARPYVGVIGYHEYPYGSDYSSLASVLAGPGTGNPSPDAVAARNQLRDLGRQYGVPVWLTEVSHGNVGGVQGDTFDALRARAIDINDNLVYANMSGFLFQEAYWDTVLQQDHFGSSLSLAQLQAEYGDSTVVVGDPSSGVWQLTMGAYALGHYSRWVRPGDVRVKADSSNPLVEVTAFRDDRAGTDSFVLINNSDQDQEVTLVLAGASFGGVLSGEQSTAAALGKPLGGISPTGGSQVTFWLPARSVTSLSAPLGSAPVPPAPPPPPPPPPAPPPPAPGPGTPGPAAILGRVAQHGEWWVTRTDGSQVTTTLWTTWNPSVTWVDVRVGDFNGDGKEDLLGRALETGQWWVGLSTGSSFTTTLWTTWNPSVTWVDVRVGDFNGDGKMDIAGRALDSGDWWVGISNGSGFTNAKWTNWNPSVTWTDVVVGDFNGDGRADIAGRVLQTGQWWVGRSTGAGFVNSLWTTWNPSVSWVDVQVGDFNGDRMADIVGRVLQTGQWWVGLSGGAVFNNTLWATWSTAVTWADVRVGDFNGDGKADIVGRAKENGQWWVGLSSGSGFATTLWATWSTAVNWVDVLVADLDGDGKADIVGRAADSGQWFAGLSGGAAFSTRLWATWSPLVSWADVRQGRVAG